MTGEELISELPKGLLCWYPFQADTHAVILGADESITSAYRQVLEGKHVQADSASFDRAEAAGYEHASCDYVIITSQIERRENPAEVLQLAAGILKPDGVLLLAANNRFGIRYFCGDRDPYTERNFDGIENYARAYLKKEDSYHGRMYARAELEEMLEGAGFGHRRFYSVFNDLENPCLIYGEDYLPNEDLTNRVFPTYHNPSTVFLEEEQLYGALAKNGMFHSMANAYLVECAMDGKLQDILHVTCSMERGREDALYTVIRKGGTVEKCAVYSEGREKLEALFRNGQELAAAGIRTVAAEYADGIYRMPYIEGKVGQLYLKELLMQDREKFLKAMDTFRDRILASSEIVRPDSGDGEGAVLKFGYPDMVPLNSFYMNGDFVFYDQEFREENYPANAIIWRMIATFYSGNLQAVKVISRDELIDRYGLRAELRKWQVMEGEFLTKLRKERELSEYHKKVRRNADVLNSNRQRMNYSADEYQKLFIDIFHNADTRKLILFGSGAFAQKFLFLYRKDYPVYAVVDNNPEKWGQEIDGMKIQPPDILRELKNGEYKVIICIKNYLSVMKQLKEMGVGDFAVYDRNKDYPRKRKPITTEDTDEKNSQGNVGQNGAQKPKKRYHIGYVAGVFDMFHLGHVNLLRRAKELCDYLIVGVMSDEAVYRLKEKYPIIPGEDRVAVLEACRYADQVELLPNDYDGIRDAYRMFHFDVQFSGDDHSDSEEWQKDRKFLNEQGADIVFFDYTKSVSSTMLRKKLSGQTEG